MDLKRRLAQYDSLSRRARPAPGEAAPCGTEDPRTAAHAREATLHGLGLRPVEGAGGVAWRRDLLLGTPPPAAAQLEALAWLFPAAAGGAPEAADVLLLDAETTGLAGGTGTLAFLIGCAWWEGERLIARQWLLPEPGREPPLLDQLGELAARFRVVVTYNGAVFDLPLLRGRALLNRLPDPCGALAGWDLLPATRRLWGRRLPDCRQQTVEAQVCGLSRGADEIDGALIPQVYARYLREARPGRMPAVLRHNAADLEGMAAILGRTARAAAAALGAEHPGAGDWVWQDAWSAARLCERLRRKPQAAAWIEHALAARAAPGVRLEPGPPPQRLYADAVRILKRARAWPRVAALLDEGLALWGDLPWLHREAAVLYEHRLRSPERAWRHARALGEAGRLARLARKESGGAGASR